MEIIQTLKEKIEQEKYNKGRAIIFWYDPDQQITIEELEESLRNEDVLVHQLTQNNFLKLKIEIEINNPDKSYLLYAPFSRPTDQENYLLDILLYSAEFKADQVAVLAEQLFIKDHILRPYIDTYSLFFRAKDRREKLKKVLPKDADQRQLDMAILAVLTNTPSVDFSHIVKNILVQGLDEGLNESYKKIQQYFSLEVLWRLIQQNYGIIVEDKDKQLQYLMTSLLYQHFKRDALVTIEGLDDEYTSTLPNACGLFIDDWMRGQEKETVILEEYIKDMEARLELRYHLQGADSETIDKVTTFPVIDILLMEKVNEELQYKVSNLEQWQHRIQLRLKGYWGKKEKLNGLYNVLLEAVRLTEFKTFVKKYNSEEDLYHQYAERLYLIDQAYRRLMETYTKLQNREMVESLVQYLTNWYENIYLLKIAEESNRFIMNKESSKVPQQRDFFESKIQPILEKESTKVFVIISDALRYEAGEELSRRLNKRVNGESKVSSLFSSLPSYTQLGMASLLPNKELTIRDKIVYADEKPTSGLSNREKCLQDKYGESATYHLDELLDLKYKDAEEKLRGKRLIYLYHDVIDAMGDARKSERETYDAVRKAINALELAVDRLSKLQAKRIFITSDHGFLFQVSKVEADSKAPAVTGDILDNNRRFYIGKSLSVPEGAMKLDSTQTPLQDVEVVIAKGLNRFIKGGGLQFIHGGAMPQETVVPVIEYRRTEKAKVVDVSVAVLDKNITNYRVPVSFYQEESISSEFIPRKLKMAFYKNGERISNEILITFDLIGDTQKRNRALEFTLIEKYYQIGEKCTLRLETIDDKKVNLYKEEEFTIRLYDALY